MTNANQNPFAELFDLLLAPEHKAANTVKYPLSTVLNCATHLADQKAAQEDGACHKEKCGEKKCAASNEDALELVYTLDVENLPVEVGEGDNELPIVVLTSEEMLQCGVMHALVEGKHRNILAAVEDYEYDDELSYKGNVRKALDEFFAAAAPEVATHVVDPTPGPLVSRASTIEEVAAFLDSLYYIVSDDLYAGFVEFPATITLEVLGEYSDRVDSIIPADKNTIAGVHSLCIEQVLEMIDVF